MSLNYPTSEHHNITRVCRYREINFIPRMMQIHVYPAYGPGECAMLHERLLVKAAGCLYKL